MSISAPAAAFSSYNSETTKTMSSLDARYISHLRNRPKVHTCTLCKDQTTFANSDGFLEHLREYHTENTLTLPIWTESQGRMTIEAYVLQLPDSGWNTCAKLENRKKNLNLRRLHLSPAENIPEEKGYHMGEGQRKTTSSSSRLCQPASAALARNTNSGGDGRFPTMVMQPDWRPISQEQLSAEVKSIYAGLVVVESKCIHIDKGQASAIQNAEKKGIADSHWQSLIAIHRTLLHEHHDFFLASQHPSASLALRRLATKYTMPARMWKHGIHSFLELLRYRLPDSLEFMISFIYTAYQMMSLLYETIPAFEDTWIECLGDLGRYRMAIEAEDIRDRETWTGVARFWYSKAAERLPEVGRLYHHLAILARPNGLQQLYLYSRSLTSVQVFLNARESILTLFNPLIDSSDSFSSSLSFRLSKIDTLFITTHAMIFGKTQLDKVEHTRQEFFELLNAHIEKVTTRWREQGAYIMIINIGSLYDFGTESPLRRLFDIGFTKTSSSVQTLTPLSDPDFATQTAFRHALTLTFSTATLVLRRKEDKNVLPFVHILVSFLLSLSSIQQHDFRVGDIYVAGSVFEAVPWNELCLFLNYLAKRYESATLILSKKEDPGPLPEDYLIRGQVWSQKTFPEDWFKESELDDGERSIETASTVQRRVERVLWLAFRLAVSLYHPTF
jgi:hypothetical protein